MVSVQRLILFLSFLLISFGSFSQEVQDPYPGTSGNTQRYNYPTSGEAYSACLDRLNSYSSTYGSYTYTIDLACQLIIYPEFIGGTEYIGYYAFRASRYRTSTGEFAGYACVSNQNAVYQDETSVCKYRYREFEEIPDECELGMPFESSEMFGPSEYGTGAVCYEGCAYDVSIGLTTTFPIGTLVSTFTPRGTSCTPSPDMPLPTVDEDFTHPDYLDLDPGEGGNPDPGPDPGDGSGKGESSGGGDCSSAPSCSGDSLQCNILYQNWKTRCIIEANNIGGGISPEDLNPLLGKMEDIDNSIKGQTGFWEDSFSDDIPGEDPDWGSLTGEKVIDTLDFDSSGFGFPRSCPVEDIQFTLLGTNYIVPINSAMGICDIFTWFGYLLVALTSFTACFIFINR